MAERRFSPPRELRNRREKQAIRRNFARFVLELPAPSDQVPIFAHLMRAERRKGVISCARSVIDTTQTHF